MPDRRENVRVSVRKPTRSRDADWLTEEKTYSHDSWVVLDYLMPQAGRDVSPMSRRDFNADWVAGKRFVKEGTIEEGDRIATFREGSVEHFLQVSSIVSEGRMETYALDEIGAEQPRS